MTWSSPLNAGEPIPLITNGGVVTLVDGTTFCMSTTNGDFEPGGPHGLFFRDARIVSRWQVMIDGHAAQPLSVLSAEAYTARFVLRRPPTGGHADSTLLMVRERTVGDGLLETITLENVGKESTAVQLDLHVDADFADLFTVKDGRTAGGGARPQVEGHYLILRSFADNTRGLRVSASNEPLISPGGMTWRVVLPPHSRWETQVTAQPVLADQPVEMRFRAQGQALPAVTQWRDHNTEITVDDPDTAEVLWRTEQDLDALRITDPTGANQPYVAAGAPWFMTLFGRDSILTSWMALPLDVDLAMGTARTLARLQGTKVDPLTEEEPGRILHELRLGPDSSHALGGSHYYGTVDATPLFVMLVRECWRWGADTAAIKELLPAADTALEWMERYGDRDGDGFVEYRRATDRGLANQGWKDSWDGINDAAGHLADPPVALCEVQAYAYAAWLARADLADAFDEPDVAAACRKKAAAMQTRFAEQFWLPDRGWFAVALDGRKRPMDALTSNVGHCLWTGIVADDHAERLIGHLAGEDMETGYGLRTLSARMGAYNPMSYHNGSVWPHDTALCVAGLMRYGHLPGAVDLAHRLTDGLLDAAAAFSYRLPELFCGFPRDTFSPPVPYPTSCSPQAWASGAPLLLVRALLGLDPDVPARKVNLNPRLPARWQTVVLDGLRLGPATARVTVTPDGASVSGLPEGWTAP